MSFFYKARIAQTPDSREWLVIVYNRFTGRVLTVGCFDSLPQAGFWAGDTINRRAWRDDSELPDIYDRRDS